jgi:hypothetical protein
MFEANDVRNTDKQTNWNLGHGQIPDFVATFFPQKIWQPY